MAMDEGDKVATFITEFKAMDEGDKVARHNELLTFITEFKATAAYKTAHAAHKRYKVARKDKSLTPEQKERIKKKSRSITEAFQATDAYQTYEEAKRAVRKDVKQVPGCAGCTYLNFKVLVYCKDCSMTR
jgi:2-oxoglutarate dehydrogenase complex dehydrogenase (E1) component-like enzyme